MFVVFLCLRKYELCVSKFDIGALKACQKTVLQNIIFHFLKLGYNSLKTLRTCSYENLRTVWVFYSLLRAFASLSLSKTRRRKPIPS